MSVAFAAAPRGFDGARHEKPRARRPMSATHRIALALVFLTIASSGFVFTEPAPVDVLTIGLIVGLPMVGLVASKRLLGGYLCLWLTIAAAGFLAATMAHDTPRATLHFAISLYLYVAAFVFASFVALRPRAHTRLILDAYLLAALIAAAVGLVGYFDLLPGAGDLFTRHARASGTFKDPNVFGAFLVPALVYLVHVWLERPVARLLPSALAGALLALGILLSVSRGAWAACALALLIYWCLSMVVAGSNRRRLQLVALSLVALLGSLGVLVMALEDDGVSRLVSERAAVTQPYDEGPEGRFGGQVRALRVIAENPFGIGALEFTPGFHINGMMMPNRSEGRGFGDDVHNSYLSMFLNAGWVAGVLNIVIVALTAVLGLRHALRRTATQPLFLVAYAALLALLAEGLIIDVDHWRHVHLLYGVVWGLMAGDVGPVRSNRIVADRRPALMRPVLVIPPSRREKRILRAVKRLPLLTGTPAANRRNSLPRRQPRLARGRLHGPAGGSLR